MRDLDPNFAAACAAREVCVALLVFMDFEGAPARMWTGVGTLHYAGQDYQGIGSFGEIDPIEEYSEARAGQVNLTLNGVPSHALSDTATLKFKRRRCELMLAVFDADQKLIGVETLMRGSMDTMTVQRRAGATRLKLTVTNELATLRESWGRIYTDSDQQVEFPGDTGLRFVQSIQDVDIKV